METDLICRVLLKHANNIRKAADERVKEGEFCKERAMSVIGGVDRRRWEAYGAEAFDKAAMLNREAEAMEAALDTLGYISTKLLDRLTRAAEAMEDIASDEPSFPQVHADMATESAKTIRDLIDSLPR